MAKTGSQLTQPAACAGEERYPLLGDTSLRRIFDDDQLPISRFSASFTTPPKEIESSSLTNKPHNNPESTKVVEIDDPFRDGVYNTNLVQTTNGLPTSPSGLKVAAAVAAQERSLREEAKIIAEPRQTRTSSLRARLSAGQLDKVGSNKVVGFTDFTASRQSSGNTARQDSLRARKEAQKRRSITPPVAPPIPSKTSRESLTSNRAPAQFVAGSRRPVPPRRPSSRGSLRNEYRESTPPLVTVPPGRQAPSRPVSRGSVAKIVLHKSSIPALQPKIDTSIPLNPGAVPLIQDPDVGHLKQVSHVEIKDQELLEGKLISGFQDAQDPEDNKDANGLEVIEESPQHAHQIKRLSANAAGFGPTLRISPNAERFIMGPTLINDKLSLTKKKSKELDREMIKNDLKTRRFSSKYPSVSKTSERPSSSQGLLPLSIRVGLVDPKAREKKAKSTDLSVPSPKGDMHHSVRPAYDSCRNSRNRASKTSSSTSGNDPFFDAPEEASHNIRPNATSAVPDRPSPIDEGAWISPLKESNNAEIDKAFGLNEHLPAALKQQFEDDLKIEAKQSEKENPFKDPNVSIIVPDKDGSDVAVGIVPQTPEQYTIKDRNVSGNGTHPPRSSSRTVHPNFTSEEAKMSLNLSENAGEKGPPSPPKEDFETRKNNLGLKSGHGSTQLDFNKLVSNRDSTARDSYRSQSSVSKGMLSSMRGLFHKRSSENGSLKAIKKTKSKVFVQANGSPFPPMSEVHPVHRPTIASVARSNAGTPRPSLSNIVPATPSLVSPPPTELSTTTKLAMQIIESARKERSNPKKEQLLELGKIMVEALTQARDAEKAMEEAKHAARKAEVSYVLCKKALGDVERCVLKWRNEITR